jgi:multiple sugar transport system permease protein
MRAAPLIRASVLALACFALCFPLVYLVIGSFMDSSELAASLAALSGRGEGSISMPPIPRYPSIESYVRVLIDSPGFHALFQNSTVITVGVLVGQMLFGIPAAWGFATYDFRGKNALFFVYVVLMMLPFQVTLLPSYLVLDDMGLIDTHLAIIIPGALSAFPVFIMRHFFQSIPPSIIESARLDGASEMQIFLRIGIPMGAPGIFAALMLGFFEYWNIVEQPLVFLRTNGLWPLSLFVPSLDFAQTGLIFASATIAALPAVLIFLIGKEYLEQGIVALSTKG